MNRRFPLATLMAWLIFIMVDFVFHASLLAPVWLKEHPSLKPLEELALLIPAGYLSFLLLTILAGWLYQKAYPAFPGNARTLSFGVVLSGLYAVSNFLGTYSYLNLPTLQIALFNLVYFIELVAVVFVYAHFLREGPVRRKALLTVGAFFIGIILGIVVQNLWL